MSKALLNSPLQGVRILDLTTVVYGPYATRTTAEWQALFDAADIPNMPAQSLEALVQDPHHWHNGFFREVEHPTEGRLNTMGDVTHWQDTPLVPQLAPAPRLGRRLIEPDPN